MATNSLRDDDRAVEGMPIRLVVAVAVGAAALGLLLPMLDSVDERTETEVTVEVDPGQFVLGTEDSEPVTIDVVTGDGVPVEGATVLVSGRSLPVDGEPLAFETDPDSSSVTVAIGTTATPDVPVAFRPTQTRGTLLIDIVPPPGTEYRDERNNPQITIRQP